MTTVQWENASKVEENSAPDSDANSTAFSHFEVVQFVDLDKQSQIPKLIIRRVKVDPKQSENSFRNEQLDKESDEPTSWKVTQSNKLCSSSIMTLAMDSLALLRSSDSRPTLEEFTSLGCQLNEPITFNVKELFDVKHTMPRSTVHKKPEDSTQQSSFSFGKRQSKKEGLKLNLSFPCQLNPCSPVKTTQLEHRQIMRRDVRRNRRPNESKEEYEKRLRKLEQSRVKQRIRIANMTHEERRRLTEMRRDAYYNQRLSGRKNTKNGKASGRKSNGALTTCQKDTKKRTQGSKKKKKTR